MGRVEVYKSSGGNSLFRACAIILFLILLTPCLCLVGIAVAVSQFGFGELEVLQASYSEPLDNVENASVEIQVNVGHTTINALTESNNLIEADLTYVGDVTFETTENTGEANKHVRLVNANTEQLGILEFLEGFNINFTDSNDNDLLWDIGLNPDVPMSLDVEGGVGKLDLDLAALDLTALNVEVGVGSMTITVPDVNRNLIVNVNGSVGDTTIILPENAAVRVEGSLGVGDLQLPSRFNRVEGETSAVGGEEGAWETGGYANADARILLVIDGGVGEIIVR